MITARPQKNLATAREYFRQHLLQGDYHSQGQAVAGQWFGRGAERLGLKAGTAVAEAAFARLCDNQHPATGEKLTVRKREKDHRVFYDFTVSAPKSVSIMALVVGDQRLLAAHDQACAAALSQMEQVAATRVRRGGEDGERVTGEIVAATFRHDTSRALDPQLHTHFVVFNATWDRTEERWKALQTSRMFDQMTFYTEDQLTTRTTLFEEQRMIRLVNRGVGQCRPLQPGYAGDRRLSAEQQQALRTILGTPDQVLGLRGGAGTGKTRLLLEVVRGVEARQPVTVLAPSTAAVEALRKAGLPRAATVQRFLADASFREETRGHVLLVDEASLLSTRDMLALLGHVQSGGRLILSGDTRQHTGIAAGDALRLLEERSGLRMAGVHAIRRQVDQDYREAIADFAQGNGLRGLSQLERLGAVVEIPEPDRYAVLAEDYVRSLRARKSALLVSPTWREIEAVTQEVRARLKAEGLLGSQETRLTVHRGLQWTQAQKRDLRNYRPGHVLAFHRATRDFARGASAEVVKVEPDALEVRRADGAVVKVTRKQAGCFEVAEPQALAVAPGERLLIQGNRKAAGLFNGQAVTVKSVGADGSLTLADGRKIAADFRAFTHGYCVTSHAAQGRTVDHVYVAVDSGSWRATHRNQFYVSASRGRERVRVYTDDVQFLRDAVTRSGVRLTASELLESKRAAERTSAGQHPTLRPRVAA